jgi:hypothetical protein
MESKMSRTSIDLDPTAVIAVQVRLRGSHYVALEEWRRAQPKIPCKSAALRMLIEYALEQHAATADCA